MRRERTRRPSRTWLEFSPRDGRSIERAIRSERAPCCPRCHEVLEAWPGIASDRPPDPATYDLVCEDCSRFWRVVRNTARSLQLSRMRRLAAAVRAVGESPDGRRRAEEPARSG